MTLVELLVAFALLGVILGVSAVALASLESPASQEARTRQRARAMAIRTGAVVRVDSTVFLPDGRGIGATIDPLTGAVREH